MWTSFSKIGSGRTKNLWTEKINNTSKIYNSFSLSLRRYAGDCDDIHRPCVVGRQLTSTVQRYQLLLVVLTETTLWTSVRRCLASHSPACSSRSSRSGCRSSHTAHTPASHSQLARHAQNIRQSFKCSSLETKNEVEARVLVGFLWSPYGIGQTIIFLPCGFFFLLPIFLA